MYAPPLADLAIPLHLIALPAQKIQQIKRIFQAILAWRAVQWAILLIMRVEHAENVTQDVQVAPISETVPVVVTIFIY